MVYRFNLYIFLLLLCIGDGQTLSLADEKPEMLYFYSDDCENCENVKREFLPGFLKKYGENFTFVKLNIDDNAYLDSLLALESRVGVPEMDKDSPAVYFMGEMLEGEIQVIMKLEYLVKNYLANPDSMRAIDREIKSRIPEKIQPEIKEAAHEVSMVYFYNQGCKECGRAEEIISWLKKSYPFLTVDVYDIDKRNNKLVAAALGIRSGIPEDRLMSTPIFFIGTDYILSENISRTRLAECVEHYAPIGARAFWRYISEEELEHAEKKINELFKTFTIFTIAFAGLGDGINPCAFATILFFVSYLGIIGRKRNEILFVGFSFAFAVFLTYFMFGLGFFNIVKRVSQIEFLYKVIFGGTGALCIVFGFLSINDYFKARAGKTSEMALQLPAFLKRRIHTTIREKVRMKSFVAGAIITGFLVSVLELACTGQVYLPTITLMVRQAGTRFLAFSYLLLYNVCFIIPLLIVFGVVYFGVSSRGIARVMESRVGMVKLVLAVVFFVVGGLLVWTVV